MRHLLCTPAGVDNPGHPFIITVGCVAGDEESYKVFADFMDKVIDSRHGGYAKVHIKIVFMIKYTQGLLQDAKHKTDLDPNNLKGGDNLDPNYVLSSRVRTGRSIRGYGLPPHCTRAERRAVEKIVMDALGSLTGELKGTTSSDEFIHTSSG